MMRSLVAAAIAAVVATPFAISTAHANENLAAQRSCLACHSIDKRMIGPSFKDVAAKYKDDKDAVERLAKKVKEGGAGVWGNIAMPPNGPLTPEEAVALVKWVLSQK